MGQEVAGGGGLLGTQFAVERDVQGSAGVAFIAVTTANAQVREKLSDFVQAAPRQTDVLSAVLGTSDDARLVVGRQAHRLCLVELGILKGSQPDQAIVETGR